MNAEQTESHAHTITSRLRRFARNWLVPLLVVLAIMLPIRSAIADWNDVPTGSMKPTIVEGDRIFVNKLAFGLRVPFTHTWLARWDDPQRGEVVVLRSPCNGQRLVKRVIALPGDNVSMRKNKLIINGAPVPYTIIDRDIWHLLPDGRPARAALLSETLDTGPHDVLLVGGAPGRQNLDEFVVPDGHCFVMGDNRNLSHDSRAFGTVPLSQVYGRSNLVVFSLDEQRAWMPRWGRFFRHID